MSIQEFTFTNEEARRHFEAALKVSNVLQDAGYDAYFIGGAVRDMLLNKQPKDFDVVTNAKPEEILQLKAINKARYKDTAQAFGVTRTHIDINSSDKPVEVEIATYRSDIEAHMGRSLTKIEFSNLEDDLKRRDLTINALAYDPLSHELIDEVNGLGDIENKIIRFIGNPKERIKEDPLRILRAVRLKNQLRFEYSKEAKKAIKEAVDKGMIKEIATDRVNSELTKMLIHSTRRESLEDMDDLGIIADTIPELLETKGVPQPEQYHAEGDVWEHTLLAIELLPRNPSKRLAWATLFHDIAKPDAYEPPQTEEDRIRFDQHAQIGARKVKKILKRLNFSNKEISDISWMVHYHMTINGLPEMSRSRQIHYMEQDAFEDLMELHKADILSSIRPNEPREKEEETIRELETIWSDWQEERKHSKPDIRKDLNIDGNWVMENFEIEEGPKLGEIMQKLEDEYLNKNVKSKEDAKNLIKEMLLVITEE